MRGLILALQFLTRLPTPQVADFEPAQFARSAVWFPAIGLLIGTIVAAALWSGAAVDPWLGALTALAAWMLVTGALHLDGLADLADALGAAHRDPERFLAALRDPHIGTFGVVALVLVCVGKLVLLMLVAKLSVSLIALALLPAWARYGAVLWSQTLPPLASGTAERFAWRSARWSLVAWGAVLFAASVWVAPILVAAPLAIAIWWLFLKRRLGGMTGDCLGAGVELVEIAALAALVSAA
jgi:adenosylcobinamide-GDP ribazoletransferase